jgi:hypothetical protein
MFKWIAMPVAVLCALLGAGAEVPAAAEPMSTAEAEAALVQDVSVLHLNVPESKIVRGGYKVCSLVTSGVPRNVINAKVAEDGGLSADSANYFVSRAVIRLCPDLSPGAGS